MLIPCVPIQSSCNWARTQTGLRQTVTKELVTNKFITAITYHTCESQSQDQDSPVPELSVTAITNSLVL